MTDSNHNDKNSSMQLRVDEAILDYIMFSATYNLIENAKSSLRHDDQPQPSKKDEARVETLLEMVDSFLVVFRTNHTFLSNHNCDIHLQFRLRLLKFVALLEKCGTSRLHQYPYSSSSLSSDHGEGSGSGFSLSSPPSLLMDTLPHFMALSAAQLMLQGSHITDIWMKLAAGYMTHAVMEQYFVRGEHGNDVIRRAFAWGFDEGSIAEEGSDECQINAMFFDEDNDKQVEGWEETRINHVNALTPQSGISMPTHIQALIVNEFLPKDFERRLIEFLDHLLLGQPKPLLMQAETGKIDGVSLEDLKIPTRLGIA